MSLQIIDWPDFLRAGMNSAASAMTIGVFDGIHLGHQALIRRIVSRGPNPTVVTFRENPKKVVAPMAFEGDVFSLKQKLNVLEQMGVSCLILIDFSREFSKLSGWEFLELLEQQGKMAFLAIGSNFRCGYRQATDARFIAEMNKKKGIPTEVLPPVEAGTGPVSSSGIRSAIRSGNLRMAAALMGRNHELDISDIASEGHIYDVRSARRIIPPDGSYPVRLRPGGIDCLAEIHDGKLDLSAGKAYRAESLEFV